MRWMRVSLVLCTLCLLTFAASAPALSPEAPITNSGENLRTGWYSNEPSITPQLVSGGTFGRLWSTPVEGQVYAQPLLDDGTLFVTTEANKLYGLDPATGALQWSKPVSLGTPFNAEDIKCGDLAPTIGVTATPVIDPATNIAYFTYKTYVSGSSGPSRWYMGAVSVATGESQPGFPVLLQGAAQNASGQTFEPETELQRPGLLLMEGVVYAAFGSDCDTVPWQGWVFGVSTAGSVTARWVADQSGDGAGIWQSGAGLTSDGPGQILLSTGNGGAPSSPTPGKTPPTNLGESIVRLQVQGGGSLKAVDFFAPFDAVTLDQHDADFASGGVTGLPEEYFGTSAIPHLAVAVGKDGYVYLLNRDNLGGIAQGPSGSDNVVQRIGPYGGVWSRPGVWPGEGGWVYIPTASSNTNLTEASGNLRVYKYGLSGTGTPTLSLQGTSSDAFGFSSGAPVITSEGTTAGSALVWIIWSPGASGEGAQLRAYNPVPVGGEPVLRWSAPVGTASKFSTPGVGAGRLYVGTRDGHVLAFGSPTTAALTGPTTEFPTTTTGSSAHKTLTLTATEPLTLSTLSSSSSQFVLGEPTPTLPAGLATGQTIEVPITFMPTGTGPIAGTLTATTSSGRKVSFGLSGTGQASRGKLEASPPVLTFGGTSIGEELAAGATFRNVGGSPLTIEGVELPSAPFGVEDQPAVGSTIAPGGSLTVTVKFAPIETGKFKDEIGLETNGGKGSIALTGSASTPANLQITGEEVQYGSVTIGGSLSKSFTLTNIGGTALTITKSKPPIGGAFAATTSLPEGTTIAPGESLTETVLFSPTAAGAQNAVWPINGTDSSGLHEVKFSGSGVESPTPGELQVSSENLEYGLVRLGEGVSKSFTIKNTGETAVAVPKSDPPSGGAFVATTSLPEGTSIAPGESVTETVKFTPTAAGPQSAVWSINGSDTSGLHEVRFSGTGVSPPVVDQPLTPLTPDSSTPAILGGVLAAQETRPQNGPDAVLRGSILSVGPVGRFDLAVTCVGGGACEGKVVLRTLEPVTLQARSSGSKPVKAILTVASGTFAVAGGRDAQVRLRVTARVLRLLKRAHTLRVSVTVLRSPGGGATSRSRSVITLRLSTAKRAHSGRL